DATTERVLATGATDDVGSFSIGVPDSMQRDVYAVVITEYSGDAPIKLTVRSSVVSPTTFSYPSPTIADHNPTQDLASPALFVAGIDRAAPAFNILDCLLEGYEYASAVLGRHLAYRVRVGWSRGVHEPPTRYQYSPDFQLGGDDGYNDMMIHREQAI